MSQTPKKRLAALPEWERVLSSAAHLQTLLPEAVLVGGTATSLYADHRFSDEILAQLESVAGWKTARVQRPVQILGSLDGVQTGIRQLIRCEPLETQDIDRQGVRITVPTRAEMLRIKGVLILKRNATRDYLDFAALADSLEDREIDQAIQPFDRLYPQENGESATQQLQIQLSRPTPFDLEEMDLQEYKYLKPRWQHWPAVESICAKTAQRIFTQILNGDPAG